MVLLSFIMDKTAKLFEDHGYKNKKQSSGYFF